MPSITSTRRSKRLHGSSQEPIKYVEISDEENDDDVELLSAAEEDQAAGEGSNDEDQIDEDDDDDYGSSGRKRNKRGRSKSSKNQKSSNTSSKRRKRNIVSNIDKIEDFQENYIFQALSNSETSIAGLATEWLEEFQESKYGALKDLINFLLRCCGCVTQLNEHDVSNLEVAKETIAEVQGLFAQQNVHEYPFNLANNNKNPEWKDFRKRALEFVDQIILIANETSVLYSEDELVETLLTWFSAISTSNLRPLRYVSTMFCLVLETSLCDIVAKLTSALDRYNRQLSNEKKNLENLKSDENRVKRGAASKILNSEKKANQIETNIETYKEQKILVDSFLRDIFNSTYAHRYRDIDPILRQECINRLSMWISKYPEFFFESVYIRYFGWLLTDQQASVRLEVVKNLTKLYQKERMITALRQFTSHFKTKLIEIVIYETNFQVKLQTLSLLIEIEKHGFLEDDETLAISSLIFLDDEDKLFPISTTSSINVLSANFSKFKSELVKFISISEKEKNDLFIESNKALLINAKESISLNIEEMIKFKRVTKLLNESYKYYLNKYSSKLVKLSEKNSFFEKFQRNWQFLFNLPRYNLKNTSLEFVLDYLKFDLSSIDLLDEKLRNFLELNNDDITSLLCLVYGLVQIFTQGSKNEFYNNLIKIGKKGTGISSANSTLNEIDQDRDYYLSRIISSFSTLYDNFKNNNKTLSVLLLITNKLIQENIFQMTNQESILNKLSNSIIRNFKDIRLDLKINNFELNTEYYESLNYNYSTFFNNLSNHLLEITEIKLQQENLILELINELNHCLTKDDEENVELDEAEKYQLKLRQSANVIVKIITMNGINPNCFDDIDLLINISGQLCDKLLDINDLPKFKTKYGIVDYIETTSNNYYYFIFKLFEIIVSISLIKFTNAINSKEVDLSDSNSIFQMAEKLLKPSVLNKILKKLLVISEDSRLNLSIRFNSIISYIDITISINSFLDNIIGGEKSDDDKDSVNSFNIFNKFFVNNFKKYLLTSGKSSKYIQDIILDLYLIKEFQFSKLCSVSVDREAEEEVNFDKFEDKVETNDDVDDDEISDIEDEDDEEEEEIDINDSNEAKKITKSIKLKLKILSNSDSLDEEISEDENESIIELNKVLVLRKNLKWIRQRELCLIVMKISMLNKLGLVTDEIISRLRLNESVLGDLYHDVLSVAFADKEEEEEENVTKSVLPVAAKDKIEDEDESDNHDEIVEDDADEIEEKPDDKGEPEKNESGIDFEFF
ncbi:hypothetical protein B5S31_g189 [[Candida] boidinii]|nr:hypothetical protein B5S31_g189 [[Candida] boidinii]